MTDSDEVKLPIVEQLNQAIEEGAGELANETRDTIVGLVDALSAAPSLPASFDQYDRFASAYRAFRERRAEALAKVRGEQVPS